MRKTLKALLGLVLFYALPICAQFTTVTGSHVGPVGAPAANATIYWQPVTAARIGSSSGQLLGTPVTATVTAGVFAMPSSSIVDTSLSNPQYTCYAVTVIDNLTGNTLLGAGLAADGVHVNTGGAYGCVQPTGSSWSFDSFTPAAPANTLQVTGPAGTINWRGAWTATTAYAKNDGFVQSATGYVVFNGYTSGGSFGSTDTTNAAAIATGCSTTGCTFTGTVTLAADPTTTLQAATKHYVDSNIPSLTGTLSPTTLVTNNRLPNMTGLVCEGDSITYGVNVSTTANRYCDVSLTLPALTGRSIAYHNFATSGNQVADLVTRYTASVKPYCVAGGNLLSVMIGTNNLGTGGMTATATFSALTSYWTTAKADGCLIGAWTVLPRSDSSWTASAEAYRQQLNAMIRASAIPAFIFDGEAALTANGDTAIVPDHLHPNDTGHAALANLMNSVLQGSRLFAPLTGAMTAYGANYASVDHLANGTDVNTIVAGGAYDINGITNGPPGSSATHDSGESWWYVTVTPGSISGYVSQVATNLIGSFSNQMWYRIESGGTWGAWTQIGGASAFLAASTDLNTITACGSYDGVSLTNSPIGSAWTHLTVVCGDPGYGGYNVQYATNFLAGNNRMYMRVDAAGTWSSWSSVNMAGVGISSTDLNTVTQPGVYSGSSLTNAPTAIGTGYAYVEVIVPDPAATAGYLLQRATQMLGSTPTTYYRTENGSGTWTAWNTVVTGAGHGTGSSVQRSDATGTAGACFFASDGSCTATAGALQSGVTATTQTAGDNSTKVATTAYVDVKAKVNTCGTTTTCSNTAQATPRIVWGTVTLSSGTATVTGMTAFTSTSSFNGTCTDTSTTPAACSIQNTSTSSITIKGTGSDVVQYQLIGN